MKGRPGILDVKGVVYSIPCPWKETGPSSREDLTEQLDSIVTGTVMSMDLETPEENTGWDLTTSTA